MILKQLPLLMSAVLMTAAQASTVTNNQLLLNQEVNNSIQLENFVLGSGAPAIGTTEHVAVIGNNIFHGPQYLPFHPTAATIYPRVIEVECTKKVPTRAFAGDVTINEELSCDGYNWLPSMGRAEYLFVTPVAPKQTVIRVPGPERVILKEVPRKKPLE